MSDALPLREPDRNRPEVAPVDVTEVPTCCLTGKSEHRITVACLPAPKIEVRIVRPFLPCRHERPCALDVQGRKPAELLEIAGNPRRLPIGSGLTEILADDLSRDDGRPGRGTSPPPCSLPKAVPTDSHLVP